MHKESCFITLTYSDENLPLDQGLHKEHHQKFIRDLRYQVRPSKIKYFLAGEYGEKLGRPHYHAIIFGYDFKDKKLWKMTKGNPLYHSHLLQQVWKKGYTSVGTVTLQSARYVASYCNKKVTGARAAEHYTKSHLISGNEVEVIPEYAAMSNGLGKSWLEKFEGDVYPSDNLIHQGKKVKTPRYYDKQQDPELIEFIKEKRRKRLEKHKKDLTPYRLSVRENHHKAKHQLKRRTLK